MILEWGRMEKEFPSEEFFFSFQGREKAYCELFSEQKNEKIAVSV